MTHPHSVICLAQDPKLPREWIQFPNIHLAKEFIERKAGKGTPHETHPTFYYISAGEFVRAYCVPDDDKERILYGDGHAEGAFVMAAKDYRSFWTTGGRTEAVKELAASGLSAAKIALRLNARWGLGITRNAIIGKCARDGIPLGKKRNAVATDGEVVIFSEPEPEPATTPIPSAKHTGKRGHNFAKAPVPDELRHPLSAVRKPGDMNYNPQGWKGGHHTSVAAPANHHYKKSWPSASPGHVPIMQLKPHHCRWPYDTDTPGKHLFCGYTKQDGSNYCPTHHALSRSHTKSFKDSASAAEHLAA